MLVLACMAGSGNQACNSDGRGVDLRIPHRCFGYPDARPFQVFLQPHVQLVQTSQLQVGHRLLLVLDVASGADLVCSRHGC